MLETAFVKQVWQLKVFSHRTVSSVFVEVILNSFQGTALVLVERVEKGNLKRSGYYFPIVGFRGR